MTSPSPSIDTLRSEGHCFIFIVSGRNHQHDPIVTVIKAAVGQKPLNIATPE